MQKLSFQCAGLAFTITIQNGSFNPSVLERFRAEPAGQEQGIRIDACIKPGPKNTEYSEIIKPPDVTLTNDTLTIIHPLYDGIYHIGKREGTVSASNMFALTTFIRVIVSVIIVDYGGLAVHSSCILKNEKAHIFSGPSGCGKSTIIKLTEKSLLYSDEVTLVRKDAAGVFTVFHSPFRSEFHTEPLKPTVNIAGIFFLKQDSQVYLEPLSQTEALFKMLPCIFFPVAGKSPYQQKIFHLCCEFLEQVKPAIMHFRKDNSFWGCIQ